VYTVEDAAVSNRLTTVTHDRSLAAVLQTMFDNDYTQIGVARDGDLTGVVTYRSVVRALLAFHEIGVDDRALGKISVDAAVEEVVEVSPDTDMLDLFDVLAEHTYAVTYRDGEPHVVTDYDLLTDLQRGIEPFLMIEDVELALRDLFGEAFGDDLSETLQATFDDDHPLPTPETVEHCSFGHYAQFVSIHWEAFEPHFEDRQDIVRELIQAVGDLRNRLFHFRADREDVRGDVLRFAHSYLVE